eukprot:1191397-Prorocentrum_minimum.AAC.4
MRSDSYAELPSFTALPTGVPWGRFEKPVNLVGSTVSFAHTRPSFPPTLIKGRSVSAHDTLIPSYLFQTLAPTVPIAAAGGVPSSPSFRVSEFPWQSPNHPLKREKRARRCYPTCSDRPDPCGVPFLGEFRSFLGQLPTGQSPNRQFPFARPSCPPLFEILLNGRSEPADATLVPNCLRAELTSERASGVVFK